MDDLRLERELRDLFAAAPRVAPTDVVDGALERSATAAQRRPRFARLDRRAWPPQARSITDPVIIRGARLMLVGLVVLLAAGIVAIGAHLLDQPPRLTLDAAGRLEFPLRDPTAVLWPDGRLLVDGELFYDLDTAETTRAALFALRGLKFAAHPLADGRVMLVLGTNGDDAVTGERFAVGVLDPGATEARMVGALPPSWFGSASSVLPDGRVLVSGGIDFANDAGESARSTNAAIQLFDPATGSVSDVGSLAIPRFRHAMVPVDSDRVLVVGGSNNLGLGAPEVELFDLSTRTSTVVGTIEPGDPPHSFEHALLADGRVLILGASVAEEPCGAVPSRFQQLPGGPSVFVQHRQRTYLFDPGTKVISEGPMLPHFVTRAVALDDGRAIVFNSFSAVPGGCGSDARPVNVPWLAVVDPSRNTVFQTRNPFTGEGQLDIGLDDVYSDGVLLPDGRVALLSDADNPRPNAVDILTVGP
jgi:hypothetical protein